MVGVREAFEYSSVGAYKHYSDMFRVPIGLCDRSSSTHCPDALLLLGWKKLDFPILRFLLVFGVRHCD